MPIPLNSTEADSVAYYATRGPRGPARAVSLERAGAMTLPVRG